MFYGSRDRLIVPLLNNESMPPRRLFHFHNATSGSFCSLTEISICASFPVSIASRAEELRSIAGSVSIRCGGCGPSKKIKELRQERYQTADFAVISANSWQVSEGRFGTSQNLYCLLKSTQGITNLVRQISGQFSKCSNAGVHALQLLPVDFAPRIGI
jgi:hypothetical protein